jgi:hypothetical protein
MTFTSMRQISKIMVTLLSKKFVYFVIKFCSLYRGLILYFSMLIVFSTGCIYLLEVNMYIHCYYYKSAHGIQAGIHNISIK